MDRLTAMEALVRVVEAGSFSAAARQWGRSKAVVSKYVSALEGHLGVELIRRTSRSLSLTQAGRTYHRRCRELLGEIDDLESLMRDERLALRGTLRITAPPEFVAMYLHLMTTAFLERHPEVCIDLDLTHRMVDLVEEGIDLAIRATDPDDSSLVARRIVPSPILALASPSYLAARGEPETPSDLLQHACLVDTNFRDQQRWRFEVDGRAVTVNVSGPVRANSPSVIRDLAVAGHGIALSPLFMVSSELSDGRLREILPGMVTFQWWILAVYPRRRYLTARVRTYIDHLIAALGSDSAEPTKASSASS